MPDTLITNLTDGNPAQSGDEIPINRGGLDRKITAGSIAALASGGGLPLQLPIQSGRYYSAITVGTISASTVLGVADYGNTMFAIPFVCSETKTWTEIGISCATTEAGVTIRLGIYSSGSDGLPDARAVDAGEIELSTADVLPITISQSLTANTRYWLVALFESGALGEVLGYTGSQISSLSHFMFGASGGFSFAGVAGVLKAQAYGALPASFGAIDDYDSLMPYIWLRT